MMKVHATIWAGKNEDLDHTHDWNVQITVKGTDVERGFDSLQGAYDFIQKWARDRNVACAVTFGYLVQ